MTFVFIHEGDKGQYILIISGFKLNSCSSSFLYNISTLEKHNLNILCWCSNITGSANVKKTYLNKHFYYVCNRPFNTCWTRQICKCELFYESTQWVHTPKFTPTLGLHLTFLSLKNLDDDSMSSSSLSTSWHRESSMFICFGWAFDLLVLSECLGSSLTEESFFFFLKLLTF